jgi:radical SAM superfamily enzyme YgiQ (UPF0313 family)
MNILLLNPRYNNWTLNVYVPLGLSYVAAALETKGHDVQIIDLNARYDRRDYHRALGKAEIIGLTGMVTEYNKIIQLAQEVRRNSDAYLIIGGPLASALPHQILNETGADVLVLNEGEITAIELCTAIQDGGLKNLDLFDRLSSINGIAYKFGGSPVATDREYIKDINSIRPPARHLLDMEFYIRDHLDYVGLRLGDFGRLRGTNMISSRGCPFSCSFCSHVPWGHHWRPRSPEDMVAEMMSLDDKYGINEVLFVDDNFTLNRQRVMEFCSLVGKVGLKTIWSCNTRVDLVDSELLMTMYAAGCRTISYGIESGNQQVLNRMGKKITLNQVKDGVLLTKRAGITPTGYFILGTEGETKRQIIDTMDFARELKLGFYSFSYFTPLPASQDGDRLGLGKELAGYKEYSSHANRNVTADCTNAELEAFGNYAFREFYLKRRFGKYYWLNLRLWLAGIKVIINLIRRGQINSLWERIKAAL